MKKDKSIFPSIIFRYFRYLEDKTFFYPFYEYIFYFFGILSR